MARFIDVERDEELREIQRQYSSFIDDRTGKGTYYRKIQDMIADNRRRLLVNINDLRLNFPERAQRLLRNGFEELICLENAFRDVAASVDPEYVKEQDQLLVGIEGSFGVRHVNPRTLKSYYLGNLVCCEGIVTKCSLVRPKVIRSVHYCPQTAKIIEKKYSDFTSYDAYLTNAVYPTEDENNNPLETEYGLCRYKDHQVFTLQELPETAPAGQLPRFVDIIADDDLADWTILIANNVQLLAKEAIPVFRSTDIQRIREFLHMKGHVIDILARSLAPSIYGHEEVKKAILCMLLGGVEKVLPNGTRLRGDINILLIGDPSVAKSQLLRYVLNTAPRAVCTTGRGSSGVGLTAAVTTDSQTGEKRLEAGAMVLADRGVVCIDEFDKMTDVDRTTIHEVMEQGRVTISKAGIQARLNARCAVLAAANPVYGRYDEAKSPMENIGMQDSLLSRFDLLFVLLDEHGVQRDNAVAEYVVKIHRFRAIGEEDGAVFESGNDIQSLTTLNIQQEEDDSDEDEEIFERNAAWLPSVDDGMKCVTISFMRKYIQIARQVKPMFTDQAGAYVAQRYAELRAFDDKQSDKEKTQPVTARMLETMIRLSTAFAKARLGKTVTVKDAEQAFKLLSFACYKKIFILCTKLAVAG
ncbi:unnamed protein product [Soboliphyme baturini]|uniref:DNA replication licensing factor MCM3 n=1 Tax=Soboliphyme baturini TaxID=241478 RepID=A0A183IP43_9BILA|nr:unnamed protein product [Soboliphyme baturini]